MIMCEQTTVEAVSVSMCRGVCVCVCVCVPVNPNCLSPPTAA